MQVTAILRYAHISPQKCRLVADTVRGKAVGNAIATLKFMPKKGAALVRNRRNRFNVHQAHIRVGGRLKVHNFGLGAHGL